MGGVHNGGQVCVEKAITNKRPDNGDVTRGRISHRGQDKLEGDVNDGRSLYRGVCMSGRDQSDGWHHRQGGAHKVGVFVWRSPMAVRGGGA